MHFLAPTAFAFAAVIPVVILFYLLKRKRVVKLVSSTVLWQKFLAETQASAPFQRLRHNWLLIIQLILLTLVVLALTRPYFAGKTLGGRLFVTILDASASMQSTDEEPSRFETARRAAIGLVNSMHDNDQMVILHAAGHTEVKQSPTSNKAALRRALQACAVTDSPTRLSEALKLAHPLTRERGAAEIHIFSDGAASDLGDFEYEALNIVYHRCGRRARNAGIVTLEVRSHPEDATKRALFVSVANASTNAVRTELELLFEGQLLETRSLSLPPRETVPQVFTAAQAEDGIFTLRLAGADDLAVDNHASILSLLPQTANVLLATKGNRFLEKALTAVPNVNLSVAADIPAAAGEYDFTVIDGITPAVWPAGNLLAVGTVNSNWFEVVGTVETPPIVDWKGTHPLLRFAAFDNVVVNEALAVKTPSWAAALVESPNAPLVLAGELGRQRIVWVAFDILQSSWFRRMSFPIFIANAVDWLNPATIRAAQFSVRSGEPLRWAPTGPVTAAKVILPDRSERPVAVGASARELVFGDTTREGVYRFEAGTNSAVFCVNLLDAPESDTTPRPEIQLGKYSRSQATTARQANMELWRWIAAVGLAFLMFEWWFYHRRTA